MSVSVNLKNHFKNNKNENIRPIKIENYQEFQSFETNKDFKMALELTKNLSEKFHSKYNILEISGNFQSDEEIEKEFYSSNDITQDWKLYNIFKYKTTESWKKIFLDMEDVFNTLDDIIEKDVQKGDIILPLKKDILKPFQLCDLDKIKVLIVLEEPYCKKINGQYLSTGIPLQVADNCEQTPELKNINKSLNTNNLNDFFHWYEQGVFMIHMNMTVPLDIPSGHKDIWDGFLFHLFSYFQENDMAEDIINVFFGKTNSLIRKFKINENNVIKCPEPKYNYFLRRNIFKEINDELESRDITPIVWSKEEYIEKINSENTFSSVPHHTSDSDDCVR